MFQTILGIVLFFIPFILVFNFQDRTRGFLYVFTSVLGFHIIIALLTQIFHIFSFPLVFSIHLLVGISCLVIFLRKKKYFSNIKFSWLVLLVFMVVGFELSSVHYFYKGIVSEARGLNVVSGDFYAYPHYSDEWVGVSFVDYSIKQKSLPLVNPLWYNQPLSNGFVVFYSFISEVFLFLGLNPLVNWSLFAILNGLLISFLIYLLLKANNISSFSSALAAMSVPLIVNGHNLSGVWFFIPVIFALSVYLVLLICLSKKEFTIGLFVSILCFLLYPPFIVFIFPTLFVYILHNKVSLFSLFFLALPGIGIISLLSTNLGFSGALNLVHLWLIRPNLDGGGIISMPFWVILPTLLIPFIVFGPFFIIKKRLYVLISPIVCGVFCWIFFSFVKEAVIIDQTRSITIASIILIILVGFGVEFAISFIKNFRILNFIKAGFILAFIITAFFYPGSNTWSKLVLKIKTDEKTLSYSPLPPITRYLYPDDLEFFGNFSGKRFLSHPLKGLAIGVATHNYPLDSKASTVTNRFLRYYDFMESSCEEKTKQARDFQIDYIYSFSFSCPHFEKLGSSQEGFHFYKFVF